jgi:hypothetical protein
MESAKLGELPDELLAALGARNFKLMHYDIDIIADKVNKRLDQKQKEFNEGNAVR